MKYHSPAHAQTVATLAQANAVVEDDDPWVILLDEFMEASWEASLPALDVLYFDGQLETIKRQDKAFSEAVELDLSSPLEKIE